MKGKGFREWLKERGSGSDERKGVQGVVKGKGFRDGPHDPDPHIPIPQCCYCSVPDQHSTVNIM